MLSLRFGNVILFAVILTMTLLSCGQETSEQPVAKQAAEVQSSPAEIIESDPADALITYMTGKVSVISSGSERIPEIGDSLQDGDKILTGPEGFVELQYGNLSAIRIQENSIYILQEFSTSSEKNKASGLLSLGSLVAKVRKLTGGDSFEVNVANAVCAVRGTEFLVRADSEGSVTIAVAEGTVQVAPPSLAAGNISDENAETLMAIFSLMPLISAKEEIVLSSESLIVAEAELLVWKEAPDAADQTEALALLTERMEKSLVEVPSPVIISKVNSVEITNNLPVVLTIPSVNKEMETPDPELVTLTVIAEPSDSRIVVNGQLSGRGTSSRVFIKGESISIQVLSTDDRTLEQTVIAGDEAIVSFVFEEEVQAEAAVVPVVIESISTPETQSAKIEIDVEPNDATIFVNGNEVGRGNASIRSEVGKAVRLRIVRPGFEPYSREFAAQAGSPNIRIELEPRLLVRKAPLPGAAVGTPATGQGYVAAATDTGILFALNQNGERVWTFDTANRGGENTSPVISGNRVYSIGNTELVILDLPTGNLINRIELTGDRPDIYGRRPLPMGNTIVLPTDSALEFLNPESGELLKRMEIPQGSRMTPAIWNRQLITADQRGNLLYIDPDGMNITRKVGTEISQPTGQAPAISSGGIALLSGRRGTVCAVNLAAAKVLWRRPLSESESVRVYTDIIVADDVAYVYGNETLYALNIDDGRDQFPPITGVSAPPMVSGDLLVLSYEGGLLVFHNRRNGQFLGEVVLRENSVARPVQIGPYIIATGESSAFVIDPRSIPGSQIR